MQRSESKCLDAVEYHGISEGLGFDRIFVHRPDTVTQPLPHFVRHSPDGFSWGYAGSGCAESARCILADYLQLAPIERSTGLAIKGAIPEIDSLYMRFKFDVIARFPQGRSWTLTGEQIGEWLRTHPPTQTCPTHRERLSDLDDPCLGCAACDRCDGTGCSGEDDDCPVSLRDRKAERCRSARASAQRWLSSRFHALIVATIVILILSVSSRLRPTAMDNYVWLADAWLHGKLWLPHFPGPWIDAMPFHGKAWIVEAPLPAVLLVPFVAVFGLSTNQTVLGVLLAGLSAYGFWRLGEKLGLETRLLLLFTGLLVFGTSLAFCASDGAVWFIAHLGAVAFTSLAIAELYGENRGWLLAFWAILAAFSRYPLLLALPGYAALSFLRTRRLATLAGFCSTLAPAIVAYVAYNYARWGTFEDIGFALWYRIMDQRSSSGRAPFDLENLGMQTQAFFARGPIFSLGFPFIRADKFGLALSWTTPALIVALLARTPQPDVVLFWLLTIATAVPAFLYYDLGGVQLGMRHSLDFLPFLLVLVLFALREPRTRPVFVILATYSIIFGVYQLVLWEAFPR